ncbi:MAG: STAS domain-containing protein [Candidatus Omnitrophica bacterium]|nr:STAS domain-containing protein [Candidatus Omnitrophota bacterium]MDD5552523.1 STAS domain-containing protein [Candidatus Omnitrophota bacterium]
MALTISTLIRKEDNAAIFRLKGSLDSETYEEFTSAAKKELEAPKKVVLLDLEALDYISSMGVSAILEVRKLSEEQGASFMMVNIPKHIDKVFQIINALPDMKVFASIKEADAYLLEMQKRAKEE